MPNVITVGEDSRINILKIDTQAPVATIGKITSNVVTINRLYTNPL